MDRDDDNPGATLIGYGIVLVLVVVFCIIFGVTDPKGATRTLTANKYTNIKMTGYRWFSGTGDWYHTGFSATAPNGDEVTGTVGSGLFFKGHTIRLD